MFVSDWVIFTDVIDVKGVDEWRLERDGDDRFVIWAVWTTGA
jgi:hypothetical protein